MRGLRPSTRTLRGAERTATSPTQPAGSRCCLARCANEIAEIKAKAPAGTKRRPTWPMIVFRHPEGMDRPAYNLRQEDHGILARPTRFHQPMPATLGTSGRCSSGWVPGLLPAGRKTVQTRTQARNPNIADLAPAANYDE